MFSNSFPRLPVYRRVPGVFRMLAGFPGRKLSLALQVIIFSFACLAGTMSSAKAADVPLRVACVGDSITFGAHLKNPQLESYPAVLGQMLGAGFDVRNFGVGGATLLKKGDKPYFKQSDYTNSLAYKPDIVVILLGTNDSKHRGAGSLNSDNAVNNWQYKENFVSDYEYLISQFRSANPDVRVFVGLPTPCFPGSWGINNSTIQKEIIPLIREVSFKTKAKIIDLISPLAGRRELFPDTVHPNAEGAKLIAMTVLKALTDAGLAPSNPQSSALK